MESEPVRDTQTVTEQSERIMALIEGVRVRYATTHVDDRGTVTELYSEQWEFDPLPLVYAYEFTIRPGKVKGWGLHREHDDRVFVASGTVRIVLYDSRPDSPTHGIINEMYFSEHNRGLVRIPRGVWHALQNVGQMDAMLFSVPTAPYDHANPDHYRLPPDTDQIPFDFTDRLGK